MGYGMVGDSGSFWRYVCPMISVLESFHGSVFSCCFNGVRGVIGKDRCKALLATEKMSKGTRTDLPVERAPNAENRRFSVE